MRFRNREMRWHRDSSFKLPRFKNPRLRRVRNPVHVHDRRPHGVKKRKKKKNVSLSQHRDDIGNKG